jgi:hypothetical protein
MLGRGFEQEKDEEVDFDLKMLSVNVTSVCRYFGIGILYYIGT